MPPPTHTTESPPSRGCQKKPHHQTPHETTTTTPPNPHQPRNHTPHHQPPHWPNPTPCTTPAAVRQHLSGLGDQEVLRLCTSGTTQHVRAINLVQAATLWEGIRDFLFDAFLHVARHDRPLLATPDGRARPPQGTESGCPPSTGGGT